MTQRSKCRAHSERRLSNGTMRPGGRYITQYWDPPPTIVTTGVSVRMGVGGRRHRQQRRTMLPRLPPQRSDVARFWMNRVFRKTRRLLRHA